MSAGEDLKAELEAVKRREASFRVKMVHEFLDRGERNTYLHTLREERAALAKRGQEAAADLETLSRKLEAACRKADAQQAELDAVKGSVSWRLARLFSSAPAPAAPTPAVAGAPAKGAVFTYYLHTSPFRIYRGERFTLRGWAWPDDGGSVTGIRANVDGLYFDGRLGLDEPEVIARYGPQPANPKPGFEITFDTPAGMRLLALEARVAGEWRTVMQTSIWCEPAKK
jgi:predicted oxidoreductase